MLLDGELDAVLGEKSDHPDLRLFFPDRSKEELSWFARNGVVPINHMVVVKQDLSEKHPEVVVEVHRMLREAAAAQGHI
jgi:4,5-dihydroxyphthalate decarboxylase